MNFVTIYILVPLCYLSVGWCATLTSNRNKRTIGVLFSTFVDAFQTDRQPEPEFKSYQPGKSSYSKSMKQTQKETNGSAINSAGQVKNSTDYNLLRATVDTKEIKPVGVIPNYKNEFGSTNTKHQHSKMLSPSLNNEQAPSLFSDNTKQSFKNTPSILNAQILVGPLRNENTDYPDSSGMVEHKKRKSSSPIQFPKIEQEEKTKKLLFVPYFASEVAVPPENLEPDSKEYELLSMNSPSKGIEGGKTGTTEMSKELNLTFYGTQNEQHPILDILNQNQSEYVPNYIVSNHGGINNYQDHNNYQPENYYPEPRKNPVYYTVEEYQQSYNTKERPQYQLPYNTKEIPQYELYQQPYNTKEIPQYLRYQQPYNTKEIPQYLRYQQPYNTKEIHQYERYQQPYNIQETSQYQQSQQLYYNTQQMRYQQYQQPYNNQKRPQYQHPSTASHQGQYYLLHPGGHTPHNRFSNPHYCARCRNKYY